MRILRPALTLFLFFSFCSGIYAQRRCATVEYQKINRVSGKIFETDEQFEKALAEKIRARKKNQLQNSTSGVPYRIAVVVHVIHNGEVEGIGRNIPDEQIISQIDVLNKDFNRMNADAGNTPAEFIPVAGNLDIEFVLAKQDPNGNCTNGIVRVDGNRDQWSLSRESEFKALSYWPAEDYLNIWIIKFQGFLGYAQFPISSGLPGLEDENDNRLIDGVILDYRVFGTSDAGPFELDNQYNKGRSATHEVGHFLGLRHIWADDVDCNGSDFADDTPNQDEETYDTPAHPLADGCSSVIMFQNYMDYTDDVSMNLFTLDQIERMIVVLENSPRRNSLSASHGLIEPSQMLVDLELTAAYLPSRITCSGDRSNKTPLTITVFNATASDIDEISYSISVNQQPAQGYEVPIIFTGNSGEFEITSLPGLIIGENTITIEVWAGCDQTPQNNIISLPVTVLDTSCEPFLLYIQQNGQSAITFDLSEATFARVSVLNTMGQEVSALAIQEATNQTVPFSIAPGVYIVRIQIGSAYYSRKVYLHP
jgi:hypothetical protein